MSEKIPEMEEMSSIRMTGMTEGKAIFMSEKFLQNSRKTPVIKRIYHILGKIN